MHHQTNFDLGWIGATALLLAWAGWSAHAASVTLAWDPSPDEDVIGYRLRYGTASQHYPNVTDVGASTVGTASNLVAGVTYYFAVTAYNSAGLESLPSAEISYTVPAVPLAVVQGPVSQAAIKGSSVTLSVEAVGAGPLRYQWHKDGISIRGATGPSYTIAKLDVQSAGSYKVTVRDGISSTTSSAGVSLVQIEAPALLVIYGTPGTHYRIRYTDDLSSADWADLVEIVLVQTPFYYFDFSARNALQRFYQIVPLE